MVEQLEEVDAYAFDPEELEVALEGIDFEDLTIERLESLFTRALEEEEAAEPLSIVNHVLAETLPTLGAAGSQLPIERLAELFARFPHLTREISLYLRLLSQTDAAAVAHRAAGP